MSEARSTEGAPSTGAPRLRDRIVRAQFELLAKHIERTNLADGFRGKTRAETRANLVAAFMRSYQADREG